MSSTALPHSGLSPQIAEPRSRPVIDLFLLLCVAAGARALWMWLLPTPAVSVDLNDWRYVQGALAVGTNPYAKFSVLNWPPFWMESLYVLMKLSLWLKLNPVTCIQCFLIGGDLLVLSALFQLMRLLDRGAKYGLLLLFGYCLNPLLILLTVQHCNFDAFATFWVLLCLGFLIRFRRQGDPIDWLTATGCLGIGVFTKTFPILLWPILLPGLHRVGWRAGILGALMVTMPTALSLAPLYVLDPDSISRYVVGYRSFGIGFGLLSVFHLVRLDAVVHYYVLVFPTLFYLASAVVGKYLWRRDVRHDEDLVLLVALLLLATFTLGTGYGSQYWFWVVPLLLIVYRQFPGRFRIILWIAAVVTVATNIFEYAVEKTMLGGFWYWRFPSQSLERLDHALMYSPHLLAMVRLPMTIAAFVLLAVGAKVLLIRYRSSDSVKGLQR